MTGSCHRACLRDVMLLVVLFACWLGRLATCAVIKEDCLLLNYYPPTNKLGKLDIPDVSSQVTGAFTVEFWYNMYQTRASVTTGNEWPALGRLALFYSRDEHLADSGRVFVDTHATDGTLKFEVQGYPSVSSTRKLVPRQWHHLAFVYDNTPSAGGLSLYIDGVLDGSSDFTATNAANHATAVKFDGFTMGYDRPGLTALYNQAYLRDVRIWSVVRTSTDIQGTMLTTITAPTPNLALSLPLSKASLYQDKSGNGFDASDPGNQNMFVGSTPALTVNPGNFITSKKGAGFQMNVNGVADTALRAYYAIVPTGTRQAGWVAEFFALSADAFGTENAYHVEVSMMSTATNLREVVSEVNYASGAGHFTTTGTMPAGYGVASRFSCLLSVTSGGTYTFYVNSQDGARLYIDTGAGSTFFPLNQHAFTASDYLVVDNSGEKTAMTEKSGTVTLSANTEYRVYVVHGSRPSASARGLTVSWSGPDTSDVKQVIPSAKTIAGPLAVRWSLEGGALVSGNFAVSAGGTTATHMVSAAAGLSEATAYDIYIVSAVERYGSSDNPYEYEPIQGSVTPSPKQSVTTLATPSATTSTLTVAEGGTETLTATHLTITDADSTDSELKVTLATAPTQGTLKLSGTALAVGDAFSKAQLVAGDVTTDAVDDAPTVANTSPTAEVASGSKVTIGTSVIDITDGDTADDSVTVTITSAPASGRVELSSAPGNAITSFTKAQIVSGVVQYVHDGTASTTDSLQFTVTDGTTTTSAYTLSITVNSVDALPPTVTVGTLSVAEGGTLSITPAMLSATDAGIDDATIGFTVTTPPSSGRLQIVDNPGITISSWTMGQISDAKLEYVQTQANVNSDSFQVTATDGTNTGSATTVTINIQAVDNAATTAQIGSAFAVNEGETKSILATNLVISDADTSPSAVYCSITDTPTKGILQLSSARGTPITSFTAAQISAGTVEYAHDDSESNSDAFSFSCSDGTNTPAVGVFSITVVPQNDNTPTIQTSSVSVDEGSSVQIGVASLLATDGDVQTEAKDLTFTVAAGSPAKGVLQISGADVTSFTQEDINNLRVSYKSTAMDGTTDDTIKVTVSDGSRTSTEASISVSISPQGGNAPTVTFGSDPLRIEEGGATYLLKDKLTAEASTGSVPKSQITFTVTELDRLNIFKDASPNQMSFTQADIDSLKIRLVHDDSESSSASFVFTVDDGNGNVSPAQRLNVLVDPYNDNIPVISKKTFSCTEGATCTITTAFLSASDEDLPRENLVFTRSGSGPIFGYLQLANNPGIPIRTWSQQNIIDGLFQYYNDGSEAAFDSFNVRVSDGMNQAQAPFSITIIPVNDAPVIENNVGLNVDEGGTRSFSQLVLKVRDDDTPEADIKFTLTSGPAYGSILLNNNPTQTFTQADINSNPAILRYLQDGTDTLTDSFSFTATDGNTVLTGTFSITVNPIDDNAPASVKSGPATVTEGERVTLTDGDLEAKDSDTADVSKIIFNLVSTPGSGYLQLSGTPGQASTFTQADINLNKLSYQHDGSNTAVDTFTYSLADAAGNTMTGAPLSFTVNIIPVDDSAPTRAKNTGLALQEGELKTISKLELAYTDADTDDKTLVYTITSIPMFGMVVKSSAPTTPLTTFTQGDIDNGIIQYQHDDSETGSDRFSFKVCDGASNCIQSQRFTLTIVLVDDQPPTEVVNTGIQLDEGTGMQVGKSQLKYTDLDSDDEQLKFTVTTAPTNAIISVVEPPPPPTYSPPPPPPQVLDNSTDSTGRRQLFAYWYLADGHSPYDLIGRRHLLNTNPTFTQRDLDIDAVRIVHDSSETTDASFAFTVTDPANNVANGNFAVTVQLVDDEPPVIDVNQPLTVQERGTQSLTNLILAASDPDTDKSKLAFLIQPGFPTGGCFKIATKCTSTFTQKQIDDGAVTFENDGSATAGAEFTVTDGAGHETSPAAVFVINVVQIDDAPIVTLGPNPLTVKEGKRETLTNAYITISDSDTDAADVALNIESGPGHGIMQLSDNRGTAITSFTLADLLASKVEYQHDGSNTVTDAFHFTVKDALTTLPKTQFPITIIPVNDDPPIVDVNRVLSAREGESTTIDTSSLSASDADSPVSDIKFVITSNPTYGVVELNGATVTSFGQQDLLDGTLKYKHTAADGASEADSFAFTVTDGTNSAPLATFTITLVDVDDMPPQVDVNEGITCPEGGSRVITSDRLSLKDPDTADPANWRAQVTVPAAVGYLQLVSNPGIPITEFSQADILAGQLQYVHDGSETVSDTFSFVTKDGTNTLANAVVVQVTITPVDDTAPTNSAADGSEIVVPRGQKRVIDTTTWNYIDPEKENSLLEFEIIGPPSAGTLLIDGKVSTSFLQRDVNEGKVEYQHDGGDVFTDKIMFTVFDGTVKTQTQTLNVKITDSAKPFVKSFRVENEAATSFDGLLTMSEISTVYYGIMKCEHIIPCTPKCPKAANVVAGQYGGVEIMKSSLSYKTSGSEVTIAFANLEPATRYHVCIVGVDTAGNMQEQTFGGIGNTLGLIAAPDFIRLAEAGGETPFRVALGVKSTADLEVTVSVPAAAQANQVQFMLSHSKCEFIPKFCQEYSSTVSFTLPAAEPDFFVSVVTKAVDDQLAEGDHNIGISVSYTTTDPTYAGYGKPSDVTAQIADNDEARVLLTPQEQIVNEGERGKLVVSLFAGPPPGETVTVKLTSGEPNRMYLGTSADDEGKSSQTVVLDNSNWSTGVPLDAIARRTPGANEDTDIPVVAAVQSTVTAYNGLPVDNAIITIKDLTPPGIVLDRPRIALNFDTPRQELRVTLSTQPTALVDVRTGEIAGPAFNISSPDAGDAICPSCSTRQLMYTPSRLQFAPDTWDVPQLVIVERISDAVACGTWCTVDCCLEAVSFEVTTAFKGASQGDTDYNGTTTNLISDVMDMDRPGIRTSAALSRRSKSFGTSGDFETLISRAYGKVLPISSVVNAQGVLSVSSMLSIFEGQADSYTAVLLTRPSSYVNVTMTVEEVTPFLGWDADKPTAGSASRRRLQGEWLTDDLAMNPGRLRDSFRSNAGGLRHLLQDARFGENNVRTNRITVGPVKFTVQPDEWRDGVRYIIDTINDQTLSGDGLYSIQARTESYDENYNNLQIPLVLFALVENDAAHIIVAPQYIELAGGSTGYVQVSLQSQPLQPVTVDVVLPNYLQGWSTVSFDSTNWGQPQFVPIRQNMAVAAPADGRGEACFRVNKQLTDDYWYRTDGDEVCISVLVQSYGCEMEGEIGPEGGSLCCPTGSCIEIPPNALPKTCGVYLKDHNTYLDLVSKSSANPTCPCHDCMQMGPIVEWGFLDPSCSLQGDLSAAVILPVPNSSPAGIRTPPIYGVYNDGVPAQQPLWDNLGADAMTSTYDEELSINKARLIAKAEGLYGVMEYRVLVRVTFDPEKTELNGDLRITFVEGPQALVIDPLLRIDGKPSEGCVVSATVVIDQNLETAEDRLLYDGNDATVDGGFMDTVLLPDGEGKEFVSASYVNGQMVIIMSEIALTSSAGNNTAAARRQGIEGVPNVPVDVFESALRNIGYLNIHDNPNASPRVLRFLLATPYAVSMSPAVHISITPTNDLPSVRLSTTPLEVTEAEMRFIDTGALLYEPDSPACQGAEIWITGAERDKQSAADILYFVTEAAQADATGRDVLNIQAQFDSDNTMLILSGIAAPTEYQKALRSIAFEQPGPLVKNKPETRVAHVRVKDEYGWGEVETREIRIKPRTLPPIFTETETLFILEDTVGYGQLYAEDPQGLDVVYEVVCEGSKGVVTLDDSTGAFTYTPYPNENGKDQFLVRARNVDAASPVQIVRVEIEPVNDAPTVKDMMIRAYEDEKRIVEFEVEDVDGPDEIAYISIVREPLEASTLSLMNESSADDTLFRRGALGPFTYLVTMTSSATRSGKDSFQYKAVDVNGAPSEIAIVSITVKRSNENITAPVVSDVTVRMKEGARFNGALSAPGYVEPDYLIFSLDDPKPSRGTVKLQNNITGSYTFSAPPFFYGQDAFGYYAEGLYAMRSETANVTVIVESKNDLPNPACGTASVLPVYLRGNITASITDLLTPPSSVIAENITRAFANNAYLKYAESSLLLKHLNGLPADVSLDTHVQRSLAQPDYEPLAFVACNDVTEISCDMASTAVVLPLAYDPDEKEQLVYTIVDLPKRGKLYVHDPSSEGLSYDVEVTEAGNKVLPPTRSAVLLYRAPPTARGTPLDTFTWRAADSTGALGQKATVHVTVRCASGYRYSGAENASSTCVPCPGGTFNQAGVLDQTECYPCEMGSHAPSVGSTSCIPCPSGTYSDAEGMVKCKPCSHSSMVSIVGSTQASQCMCDVGNWQPNATTCSPCGDRTVCEQPGQALPMPKDGHWVNPSNGYEVLLCFPSESCLAHRSVEQVREGKCAGVDGPGDPAYEKVACRHCREGFFRSAGKCEKCPGTSATFYLFFLYLLALGVVLMFVSQAEYVFGALNVLVNFTQINASMYYFDYDWGIGLMTWFKILSLANLNIELASPECTLSEYMYLNGFVISVALPFVYTFLFALRALYGVVRDKMFSHASSEHGNPGLANSIIGKISQLLGRPAGESLSDFLDRCISANTLFYVWGYYYLGLMSLEFFDCRKADDRFSMRSAPDVTCWRWGSSDTHTALFPMAVAALVLFPFGILASICLLLYINRPSGNRAVIGAMRRAQQATKEKGHTTEGALAVNKAKINRFRIRFGFLYRGYEFEWYFFEAVTMAFKLGLLLTRFFVSDPMSQGMLNMVLLLARTLIVVFSRPFDRDRLDVMECISTVGNNVILFIGLVLYSGVLSEAGTTGLRAFGSILLLVLYIVLGMFVVVDTFPGLLTIWKSYKRALLRAKLADEGPAALWKRQFQGGGAFQRIMGLRAMGLVGSQTKADQAMEEARSLFIPNVAEEFEDYVRSAADGELEKAIEFVQMLKQIRQEREERLDEGGVYSKMLGEPYIRPDKALDIYSYLALEATDDKRSYLINAFRLMADPPDDIKEKINRGPAIPERSAAGGDAAVAAAGDNGLEDDDADKIRKLMSGGLKSAASGSADKKVKLFQILPVKSTEAPKEEKEEEKEEVKPAIEPASVESTPTKGPAADFDPNSALVHIDAPVAPQEQDGDIQPVKAQYSDETAMLSTPPPPPPLQQQQQQQQQQQADSPNLLAEPMFMSPPSAERPPTAKEADQAVAITGKVAASKYVVSSAPDFFTIITLYGMENTAREQLSAALKFQKIALNLSVEEVDEDEIDASSADNGALVQFQVTRNGRKLDRLTMSRLKQRLAGHTPGMSGTGGSRLYTSTGMVGPGGSAQGRSYMRHSHGSMVPDSVPRTAPTEAVRLSLPPATLPDRHRLSRGGGRAEGASRVQNWLNET
ncbi:cadherin [Pycnococcus provasolii]